MELTEGMKIRFTIPVANVMRVALGNNTLWRQDEIGTVGRHAHEAYPNLVVWFDDGEWADLEDFSPDQYEIVP